MSDSRQSVVIDEQQVVLDVVESSRVCTWLFAAASALTRAAATSSVAGAFGAARARWYAVTGQARARAVGTLLATAAGVHLALNATLGDPAGRFWLAVPTAALIVSAVLAGLSRGRHAPGNGR